MEIDSCQFYFMSYCIVPAIWQWVRPTEAQRFMAFYLGNSSVCSRGTEHLTWHWKWYSTIWAAGIPNHCVLTSSRFQDPGQSYLEIGNEKWWLTSRGCSVCSYTILLNKRHGQNCDTFRLFCIDNVLLCLSVSDIVSECIWCPSPRSVWLPSLVSLWNSPPVCGREEKAQGWVLLQGRFFTLCGVPHTLWYLQYIQYNKSTTEVKSKSWKKLFFHMHFQTESPESSPVGDEEERIKVGKKEEALKVREVNAVFRVIIRKLYARVFVLYLNVCVCVNTFRGISLCIMRTGERHWWTRALLFSVCWTSRAAMCLYWRAFQRAFLLARCVSLSLQKHSID